jgi:hypothetical protein
MFHILLKSSTKTLIVIHECYAENAHTLTLLSVPSEGTGRYYMAIKKIKLNHLSIKQTWLYIFQNISYSKSRYFTTDG